jgi:hypothetical protein
MIDSRDANLTSLRRVTSVVLDSRRPASSLRWEVAEMTAVLANAGSNRAALEVDSSRNGTATPNGLALSPTLAAACAGDFARTVQFLRGTHAAMLDVRIRYPDRPARVLYAGCGPYATLAVPLMTIFSPAEARFTLLDIHPESIQSVESIVDALGLAAFIARCEALDVRAYRAGRGPAPDVILTEVLQAGLEAEPHVAITRHLVAQAPAAVLIPEEVCVELGLVDPAREFGSPEPNADETPRERIPAGSVFVLNREAVKSWQGLGDDRLPGSVVRIPNSIERRHLPMLFTTIRVYRNHVLKEYESGLTHPRVFAGTRALAAGDTVRFHYELGSQPRLAGEVARRPPRVPSPSRRN